MVRDQIDLLADIAKVVANSAQPETLDAIVRLVAGRFNIDVCSAYLFDEEANDLVLRATVGLKQESVGTVRMAPTEGLTGLVMETMQPVFVVNPSRHPRYKFFEQSGEEIYNTFLGVPLVYHKKILGVLTVQTVEETAISEADIPVFSAIASQISATVAYTGLLDEFRKQQDERRDLGAGLGEHGKRQPQKGEKKGLLRGVPVCAGFGKGHARYLRESMGFEQIHPEVAQDSEAEISRLEAAFRRSEGEIRSLTKRLKDRSGQDQAILEAHLMLFRDKPFKRKIRALIKEGYRAEYALKEVVLEYAGSFLQMEDPYLRERASDVEDLGKRVLQALLGFETPLTGSAGSFKEDTIIVAAHISAAELVELRQERLKGIVLSRGGKTSHAAIMAKSFELPMVVGVDGLLETVKENDDLIVDGTSGLVFDRPPREIVQEYERLKAEQDRVFHRLGAIRDAKAETLDGHGIRLGANIGLLSDLELVKKYGADHIGLYRTEFPFLARRAFPSEEEQFSLYTRIVEGAEGRPVTIRTLDVGGDKFLPYLEYPKEDNPYLGWRSIRVSLELDYILRTQLRAILRASAAGAVSILFPMISSVEEVKKITRIVEEEKQHLKEKGYSFDAAVSLGIMVEVPGAVRILERLLAHVGFASIGTNDLIQYTLAVDRNNEKVAALYNPLHPAVVATIFDVIAACKRGGKTVSICGEAASNPLCAYLYLGMGVDGLSMNPSSVPVIKEMIRKARKAEAQAALERVLAMEEAEEIHGYLAGLSL